MSDNNKKWNAKDILKIICLALVAGLAYSLGKTVFGNEVNLLAETIQSSLVMGVALFIYHFIVTRKTNK